MKIKKALFLITILTLISITSGCATKTPPPPCDRDYSANQ